MKEETFIVFAFIAVTFIFFVGVSIGIRGGREDVHTEAIKRGFAELVLDKGGKPIFRWKEVTK